MALEHVKVAQAPGRLDCFRVDAHVPVGGQSQSHELKSRDEVCTMSVFSVAFLELFVPGFVHEDLYGTCVLGVVCREVCTRALAL